MSKIGKATIKVIGIGGSGCNAITYMATNEILGVQFISINTDAQSLSNEVDSKKIQIGDSITKGLGAGANPEIGKLAAESDLEMILENVKDADMVFITCGMGGGTGTGAAPVIAKAIKDLGILTVAIVTKPFMIEGNKRMSNAENGLLALKEHVDSILVIPNDRLAQVFGGNTNLFQAFGKANEVLNNAVQGISDIITQEGFINVDFNDVKTVMKESGTAMMGMGISQPNTENKAEEAARLAISCPLLEDSGLNGAKGLIINVASDGNININDFTIIGEIVKEIADAEATIIMGTSIDTDLNGDFKVTIIATGLTSNAKCSLKSKTGIYGDLLNNLSAKKPIKSIKEMQDIEIEDEALEETIITEERRDTVKKENKITSLLPSFLQNKVGNKKE
jgi:cell division protein FtsZ